MNEIAMFVGYVVMSYLGLLAILYFVYIPLLALVQKINSSVLDPPITVLISLIKIVGAPVVLLAKLIPAPN